MNDRKYKFIDLFAGAGGLSEGFVSEGSFVPVAHVEMNKYATDTLKTRSCYVAMVIDGFFDAVVAFNAGVQNRIGNGFDHIAVVVGTAQAIGSIHRGVHHDHIRKMSQIMLAHLPGFGIVIKPQFFVSCDMRVTKKCADLIVRVYCTGRVKRVFCKIHAHHNGKKFLLLGIHFCKIRIAEHLHKSQQIGREETVITGNDERADRIIFIYLLRPRLQLVGINTFVYKKRIFLQYFCKVILLGFLINTSIFQHLQKILFAVFCVSAEIIIFGFGLLGDPVALIRFGTDRPTERKISRTEFLCLH